MFDRSGRARFTVAGVLSLTAALVGMGCSFKTHMMPAPLALQEAGDDPFAGVAPERRTTTVAVFYATDREPMGSGDRAKYASSHGDAVRVGTATVRLGSEGWDWERLASETAAGGRPPIAVAGVEEFGVLDPAISLAEGRPQGRASMSAEGLPGEARLRFAARINQQLEASSTREIFVYVPGFNITFELGLRRMAEFAHYLERDGVFVQYAWPAHSHPFAYDADRRSAIRSVEGFHDFVRFLAEETGAERIHLITSSAGAPVVSDTLVRLREEHGGASGAELRERTRIGQVVYAASDQDIDGFREMLRSGADEAAQHITVYSSSIDLGLVLTRHFGSGDKTIGRLPANITEGDAAMLRERAERVTVVDVTNAVGHAGRGDMWAHRYWYLNTWVSSDLIGVLRHGMGPARRGLAATDDGAMWRFPDDYPERLRVQMAGCPITGQSSGQVVGAGID